jgi:hypothetical protein
MLTSAEAVSLKDNDKLLLYIHIGKCGGTSVWRAINASPKLQYEFQRIERVHVLQAPILAKCKYLIVIRNPIKRALSAFNWRYKLVVESAIQKNRFDGEYDVLTKYQTLNNMAENLYQNGELDKAVANEFRLIHHLKEDIAFYIGELLNDLKMEQIYGVLATESLNEDIENVLGVTITWKMFENSSSTISEKKYLSDIAYLNLKKFLSKDYAAIKKLLKLSNSTNSKEHTLLS